MPFRSGVPAICVNDNPPTTAWTDIQQLLVFGGEKVVWLKNANFLGDDQKARSASVQTALEQLSETINEGVGSEIIFLISAMSSAVVCFCKCSFE